MRRTICLLMTLVLLASAWTAQAETDAPVPYTCQTLDYTTMIDPSWRAEWEDGVGLYFHFGEDNMPYILVQPSAYDDRITDGQAYLEKHLPELREQYGKNGAVSTTLHGGFQVAGRPVAAADIQYRNASGLKIYYLIVVDVREDFTVLYRVRYLEEDQRQQMLDGLDLIASNYTFKGRQVGDDAPQPQVDPTVAIEEIRHFRMGKAPSIVPKTTEFTCAEFTATLPAGWTVVRGGLFETYSFRCYDPEVPERCLFLMSQAGMMHKSQAGKDWWLKAGSGPSIQKPIVDAAIVLPEPSIACFLQNMKNFRASLEVAYPLHLAQETLPPEVVPDINNAGIWEVSTSEALQGYIEAMSSVSIYNTYPDASVVRFECVSSRGTACEGMAGGVVLDCRDPYYLNPTLDIWFYFPCCFTGFTAPAGELQELEPTLAACLNSFRFTDSYLRQARQQGQIVADLIDLQGSWERRDKSYDIISQKYSDATMGFDRLYDSETGEIYRADLNFYDDYDASRYAYDNPNLYKIDDSTSDYYLEPVDYYIGK